MSARFLQSVLSVAVLCAAQSAFVTANAADLPFNPPADRITDPAISGDLGKIRELYTRLEKLNAEGLPTTDYHFCKALAWADFAREEYHMNYRNGQVAKAAADESHKIVSNLELKIPPGYDTPLIANAEKIRTDLWDKAEAVKNGGKLKSCPSIGCKLAQLEVQLVWMGFRHADSGWRNANPYVQIAEDLAMQLERKLPGCDPQATPVKPTCVPGPLPAPEAIAPPVMAAPVAPVIEEDTFVLNAGGLFRYDKYDLRNMLPEGKQKIEEFVKKLARFKKVKELKVTGHTDRLNHTGNPRYNDILSQRRADTTKTYMMSLGARAEVFTATGVASRFPLMDCPDMKPYSKLTDCLQPNRRVEIYVRGEK